MKDIPGTHTERFTLLLDMSFKIGEILSGSKHMKSVEIEKDLSKTYGYEYRVAIVPSKEELRIAMDHYNFLRKYNLV